MAIDWMHIDIYGKVLYNDGKVFKKGERVKIVGSVEGSVEELIEVRGIGRNDVKVMKRRNIEVGTLVYEYAKLVQDLGEFKRGIYKISRRDQEGEYVEIVKGAKRIVTSAGDHLKFYRRLIVLSRAQRK